MDTNTKLTPAEFTSLLETIDKGAKHCTQFLRFLESQPLSAMTNKWFADAVDVRSECWDAWNYMYELWGQQINVNVRFPS